MRKIGLATLFFFGICLTALAEEPGRHIIFQAKSDVTDPLVMREHQHGMEQYGAKFVGGRCEVSYGDNSVMSMVYQLFAFDDGRKVNGDFGDIIDLPGKWGVKFEFKEGEVSPEYNFPSGVTIWWKFSKGVLRMITYDADSKTGGVTEVGISRDLQSVSFIKKSIAKDVQSKQEVESHQSEVDYLCESLTS